MGLKIKYEHEEGLPRIYTGQPSSRMWLEDEMLFFLNPSFQMKA
jgi:hypothetical protein